MRSENMPKTHLLCCQIATMLSPLWDGDGNIQCRRLCVARGALAPHFYKPMGTGAPWVEEQQTRNWPNFTDHHH